MAKTKKRLSFEDACRRYVYRFTMEHRPAWADKMMPSGDLYKPQFETDREWYEHTVFPGEETYPFGPRDTHCYTTGQTWPQGKATSAMSIAGCSEDEKATR